mmetsp:Transcript_22473/g.76362  ORF Transcript_22473/g.76362 Transcript_22473/m.76362 type:complete len:242 (+) Transcript_22473:2145-2870(+)
MSTSLASIHVALPPFLLITAAIICALQISPWPTTKSSNAVVAMPAMDIALSMDFRSEMSLSSTAMKASHSALPAPRSSFAVLTCFSRRASRRLPYSGSRLDAMATTSRSRSVTLGTPPMALTTRSLRAPSDSIMSLAPARMRSALPTLVPPYLWTCHSSPRGIASTVVGAGVTAAAPGRRRVARRGAWRPRAALAATRAGRMLRAMAPITHAVPRTHTALAGRCKCSAARPAQLTSGVGGV